MIYDMELPRAMDEIKKSKARLVCIQLPEGLKPKSWKIAQELEEGTGAQVAIWMGSCFGACDVPQGLEKLNFDLLIQWGHSEFVKTF